MFTQDFNMAQSESAKLLNVPRLPDGQRIVWALALHDDPARERRAAIGFFRIPIMRGISLWSRQVENPSGGREVETPICSKIKR